MSRYTAAELQVVEGEMVRGRPVVVLLTPMVYEVFFLKSGVVVRAEPGFKCDLASIPVIPEKPKAWLEKRPWGRSIIRSHDWIADRLARAAIPHDALRKDRRWPKLWTDYVFLEAMGVDRVPLWLRVSAFVLVLLNFSRA